MDTPDLAALVPALMARHPEHDWTLSSGTLPGEVLLLTLYPVADPTRIATVLVHLGAEVFIVEFAGHRTVDFAYEDADQREVLQERIDLAVAATTGPTRVTVESAGDLIVASSMVVDSEGANPQNGGGMSYPFRRLGVRLRGRRIARSVVDYPRVS